MARIEETARAIFRWEGGWSNHKNDRGGATMMGVTLNTYKAYCRKKGKAVPTADDLKRITRETATDVLRVLFWQPLKADSIQNQSVADIIVDNCWGSGLSYLRIVQEVLGEQRDGIMGPKTLAAINGADQRTLHARLVERRRVYYSNVVMANPSQKVFLKGWLNRLKDFKYKEA